MNPAVIATTAILSAVLLLSNFGVSHASYKCYVCSSVLSSSGCGATDFAASSASTTSSCNYCQKTVASSSLTGEVVSRACVTSCTEGGGGLGSLASSHNYCCQGDLCNAAIKPTAVTVPLIAALIITVAVACRLL